MRDGGGGGGGEGGWEEVHEWYVSRKMGGGLLVGGVYKVGGSLRGGKMVVGV